ncbi:MAG TPA: helix-turn-helix transcriptional regulator [Bacteroidota bacterium]|nr:helix-turn-helix transcriptional regulator [Bacteroidota bacterium]
MDGESGVVAAVQSITGKMEEWGVSHTFLAGRLGVSRQYVWQVLNQPTALSEDKARVIEDVVDAIIDRQMHLRMLGDRLRAARRAAGLTLKEVAGKIGYSWVVLQRWEKNVCLPGLEVLLRLCSVYGISFEIVRAPGAGQKALRHRQNGTYLVPVPETEGLPWERPSQRRPLQRMVIRISEGDIRLLKGRGARARGR